MTVLPYMTDNIPAKGKSADVFKGINTSAKSTDGELVSSDNMSARNYPAITVRQGRTKVCDAGAKINGIGVYNKMFYTCAKDDGECILRYGDNEVSLGNSHPSDARRSFASISDSILILPDDRLYKPSDSSVTELETCQSFTLNGALDKAREEVRYSGYEPVYYLGDLYSDKIVSECISVAGLSSYHICPKNISEGDIVHISMDVHPINATQDSKYFKYKETMKKGFFAKITSVYALYHEVWGEKYITDIIQLNFAPGTIDMGGYAEVTIEGIEISTKMPDLTHICAHANRVWGTEGNFIRSSALGKSWVWEDYSADTYGTLPSSCYSVEVDTGGEFTAICSFNGNLLAFKQNCIHKIYGTQPENYTLYTQSCMGVEKGCAQTLAIINGVLYYKGSDGFYTYSGGVPECISRKITIDGDAISSATDGTNYYTVMSGKDGTYLLVYYPDKGIWHRETAADAGYLVGDNPNLYATLGNTVVNLCGTDSKERFDWSFEMCFDEDTYRYKQYSRLLVKYRLASGGYFTITAKYDDNSHLSNISGNYNTTSKGYSTAELPPVRCRELRLVFRGKGAFELLDITREYRLLSDEK